MSTRAWSRSARWFAVLAVLAVAVQLWALYKPTAPPGEHLFPQVDKLGHLSVFAVPVLCWLLLWRALGLRRQWVLPAVFAAHGVVSELAQHFFYRYRDGDPFDVLADWVGVVLGLLLFSLTQRRRAGRTPSEPDLQRSVR